MGTWISAAFCLLIVVTAGALSLWLIHENKKMAAEVSSPVIETSTEEVFG